MPEHHEEKKHNLPGVKPFRKKLRRSLTPAEATLWKVLRGSKFDGRKFRRQHSVGKYILDFYCPSERLAIELDGEVHYDELAQMHDRERTRFLKGQGIKVLSFENKFVFEELEYLIHRVESEFGWWKKE